MPYTRGILTKAARSILVGLPPVTPPSWSSIMSGVNPGKHGVFGFFKYDRNTWSQRLYTALDLAHPRIHEMLSMRGVRSVMFNPIPDYPILPAGRAVIVSNLFFTPKPVSSPRDIYVKLFGQLDPQKIARSSDCGILEEYPEIVEAYLAAVERIISSGARLFWVNMNAPDILLHRCPRILVSSHLSMDEKRILEGIDKMARILGENHDHLFVVSDHGFAAYRRAIIVNDILVSTGLAKIAEDKTIYELSEYDIDRRARHIERAKRLALSAQVYRLAKRRPLIWITRAMLKAYSAALGRKVVVDAGEPIDAMASEALCPDSFSFGVYVRRRELIPAVLKVLKGSGLPIDVTEGVSFYWGSRAGDSPEIVVLPKFDEGYKLRCNVALGVGVSEGRYFDHHPEGVLIARGLSDLPHRLPNYAVTPLIMKALEEPIPSSSDYGRDGWMEEDYLSRWIVASRAWRAARSLPGRNP